MVKTKPPTAVAAAPILSEEEFEIGTNFTSLPPPAWGLNEKDKKEDVFAPIVSPPLLLRHPQKLPRSSQPQPPPTQRNLLY